MVNWPVSLDMALSFSPVSVLVAVMVAPGMTAPVGSVTVPAILPVSVCENRFVPATRRTKITRHAPKGRRDIFLPHILFSFVNIVMPS
jgi:hypothetical protein